MDPLYPQPFVANQQLVRPNVVPIERQREKIFEIVRSKVVGSMGFGGGVWRGRRYGTVCLPAILVTFVPEMQQLFDQFQWQSSLDIVDKGLG